MSNISYYIKKVYSKKNQSVPINIFLTKAKNDLMFFYTKCTTNGVLELEDVSTRLLVKNYIKAKKTKNAFNRLGYLYKLKKAKQSIQYDLYFNELSIIKSHQKIELYSNNTIYYFRLSDIVNIWVGCLTKCENMFCSPIKLKNPYTNIEFSIHNLYNIYLSLIYSNFHIPKWITMYFEAEFDLSKFSYDNYPVLKEVAIKDFIENGSLYEKYENILNMMHEYREYLNYIVLRIPFTFAEKRNIVSKLSPYLKNYLYGEYCCHPLKKKRCKNLAKRGLKRFFNERNDVPYYTEQPIRFSDMTSGGTLSSRISRLLTRSREELTLSPSTSPSMPPPLTLSETITTQRTTPRPRNLNITIRETSYSDGNRNPRQSPTSVQNLQPIGSNTNGNTNASTSSTGQGQTSIRNVNHLNGSLFNINLNNRTARDPFTPSFTLSRTPDTRNNNSNNNFNMRMFNRR